MGHFQFQSQTPGHSSGDALTEPYLEWRRMLSAHTHAKTKCRAQKSHPKD